MPTYIVTPTFDFTELEEQPFNLQKPVSDNYQLTIARMLGFDDTNGKFRLIRVGSDGRILVSTDAVKVSTGTISKVSVGVASVLVLASNLNRKSFSIYNAGSLPLFINYIVGVTVANGFPINPGGYYSDDHYVGNIWGIYSAAGQPDVAVNEV